MNLRALTTRTMLALSDGWLSDTETRDEISAHPLGAAAFGHLRETIQELTQQNHRCDGIAAEIARLTGELQTLGADHTRKARAFHNHLDALADATNDPERASHYRELKGFFLPQGLSITKRSYMEIAGATVEREQRATPERMDQLENIRVGEHTLAGVFRDWTAAGNAIGAHAQQRARLEASISRHGSVAAQASKARLRNKWIRALRLLIGAMEELPLSDRTRERFWAPLTKWLDARQQAGSSASSTIDEHAGAEPDPDPIAAPAPSAGAAIRPVRVADAARHHGASPAHDENARHERAPGALTRPPPIIPLLEPFATDGPDPSS